MFQNIICPKCHTSFLWNGTDTIVLCRQCGTRYKMHPKNQSQEAVLMPPVGRGQVDWLTVPNESTIRNRPLMKCYLPLNWQYQCSLAGDRFDLVSNPFVISLSLLAPDRSAKIVFTGESFYKHIDPSPQMAVWQNRLATHQPPYCRLKSYLPAEDYCDTLAQTCGLQNLAVIRERQQDSAETERQRCITQDFLSKGFEQASATWAGKTYSGRTPDGQTLMVYTESRIIQLLRTETVQGIQMQPMPGMFGMRTVPQRVIQQVPTYYWDISYEFTMISTTAAFEGAYGELQRIMSTLDYLPTIHQVRQDAMSLALNAQMGMAQAQAASWDRQAQIVADTNAYTSDIQHQMMADNAASHNRTANLYSEMIREVNTYQGRDGVVEASTQYDHVYQHRQDNDRYAAQQGDSLVFGVDFEELPRTNRD